MISRGTRYALAVALLILLLVTAAASSLAMSDWAVSRNDRQWCDSLNILTSQPVSPPSDPAQNPSREASYKLYRDFVQIRKEFGCR